MFTRALAPVWPTVSGCGVSWASAARSVKGFTIGPGALVVEGLAPQMMVMGVPAQPLLGGNFRLTMLKAEP
jgi:hypothetical protein